MSAKGQAGAVGGILGTLEGEGHVRGGIGVGPFNA